MGRTWSDFAAPRGNPDPRHGTSRPHKLHGSAANTKTQFGVWLIFYRAECQQARSGGDPSCSREPILSAIRALNSKDVKSQFCVVTGRRVVPQWLHRSIEAAGRSFHLSAP